MNDNDLIKEESLHIIREVDKNPSLSQRLLSEKLNLSLGKTNYLLKELVKKGILKIASFSKNPGKTKKVKYLLTKKGLQEKIKLTYYFLKVKEKEFERLKKEYDKIQEENNVK